MSIMEKFRKLKEKSEENHYDRWFNENIPRGKSFRPRRNKGYGPKGGFSRRNTAGEYQFVVTIHDKKTKESTPGSFKVLGKKTSIIRHYEDSHHEWLSESGTAKGDKILLPTHKLKFTKKVSVHFVDPVHYVKTISYWVFIDEDAYDN